MTCSELWMNVGTSNKPRYIYEPLPKEWVKNKKPEALPPTSEALHHMEGVDQCTPPMYNSSRFRLEA